MREGDPTKLLCPVSLKGPKPYPCVFEKCAAFRWLERLEPGTSKDDPLARVWGKAVGYCSMARKPNGWQLQAQFPKYWLPHPPEKYFKPTESDEIEI